MNEKQLKRNILKDFQKDLAESYDMNFRQEGFFGQAWKRKKLGQEEKTLTRTGALRESIKSRIDDTSVIFTSPLPYAEIHNEGGEIKVTARMKRFFWVMYYKHAGQVKTLKNGNVSKSRKNLAVSGKASFYKAMALKKVGDKIVIPKRQYMGEHPKIWASLEHIVYRDVKEFLIAMSNEFNNQQRR